LESSSEEEQIPEEPEIPNFDDSEASEEEVKVCRGEE
jgi:hypothetical protein